MIDLGPVYELQQIDVQLARQRAALEALKAKLKDSAVVLHLKRELVDIENQARQAEQTRKSLELEAKDLEGKAKEVDLKLYSGTVKSPKELVALQQDSEMLKRRQGEKEAAGLEQMSALEQMETQRTDLVQRLQREETTWEAEQRELRAQAQAEEMKLRELEAQRAESAAEVDPALLRQYEQMRAQRVGGIVIAKIQQGLCQGCRIAVPVNDARKARASREVVLCNSCRRMLYAP
ncbi:MAG: hypothetical protein HYX97_00030 [Chloroflexi bacterium]|nr:hypothetical protein [Chloroflexota bacterium]